VLPERLAAAHAEIAAHVDSGAVSRLSTASSIDLACREAGLVIETLPDEMEMKIDVFCILEKFARPQAILASVTELSVTEIAAMTTRGERCVAMRFDARMRQMEIVRGKETTAETVGDCRECGKKLGMEVVVKEGMS